MNNNAADASKTTTEATNSAAPPQVANGWVAKRDRHMQLINSSIYDKEAQARTKAIAETEKAKREKRTKAEEAKVMRYAQGVRNTDFSHGPGIDSVTTQPSSYQIFIHDAPFQVTQGGSKLIRQSSTQFIPHSISGKLDLYVLDDPKHANTTPKKVVVGGVTFVRSKKGNLHRLGAVMAKRCVFDRYDMLDRTTTQGLYRKPSKIKKRNELCKRFTRTGTRFSPLPRTQLEIVLRCLRHR